MAAENKKNPRIYGCSSERCVGHKVPGTGRHWHWAVYNSDGPSPPFASRVVGQAVIRRIFGSSPLGQTLLALLAGSKDVPETSDDDSVYVDALASVPEDVLPADIIIVVIPMEDDQSFDDLVHDGHGAVLESVIAIAHEEQTYRFAHVHCACDCAESRIVIDDPVLGPLVSENEGRATEETAREILGRVAAPEIYFPPGVLTEFTTRVTELFSAQPEQENSWPN
jgi:hypothetical protein